MAYVSSIYATVTDFYTVLGLSAAEISGLSTEIVAKFQAWITEGNNIVEGKVSKLSDDTKLVANSDAFTFAKNAVVNWCLQKHRTFLGSSNKKEALADHEAEIISMENILIKDRGDRTVTVSIQGASQKFNRIILPSQIDTQFY